MGIAIELPEQEVLDFFFEASMATHAGNAPKGTIVELPGSRVLVYERPPFRYVDCYFSVGEKSFGQIGIWHQALRAGPVWGMQIRGRCRDKRTIPFLKRALLAAYKKREFWGGRGPLEFKVEDEPFTYQNMLRPGSDLSDFAGSENILELGVAKGTRMLFYHEFNGLALVHLS